MAGNMRSGRKPKSEELAVIEKLSPLKDIAYAAIKKGVEAGDFKFTKLFLEYYYGKPKIIQEIRVDQEQPLFDLSKILFTKTDL